MLERGQQSLQPRSHPGQESPFCLFYLKWLLGAKVTYFGLRLRRHLPGGITDCSWDCRGALAASALPGHSPMSLCSTRPLQARLCLQKPRERTGSYSIRRSHFHILAPALKLTEIKTQLCCKGAKCHQLLAFCCNSFYPRGFKKLLSSPRILFPATRILLWSCE